MRETGLDGDVDTLGRWMAHRFAELAERAENAASDEDRETLRRECADLVFRLWERRSREIYRQPLTGIAAFLKNIREKDDAGGINLIIAGYKTPVTADSWGETLPHLRGIGERERRVCYYAALADLDLTTEREISTENADALPDEEREMIENLLEARKQLEGENFWLDRTPAPRFASLPPAERTRLVNEALEKLAAERRELFGSVTSEKQPRPLKKAATGLKTAKGARARKKKD